jgi:hypothetical protein
MSYWLYMDLFSLQLVVYAEHENPHPKKKSRDL